jgi:nitrite reductase (NO-forming)
MALVVSLLFIGVTSAATPVVSDVIKNPAEVPPPITRSNPSTVTVNLVAKEVIAGLDPAKQFLFWTYNGTVPGPMVRVMEGDTVVVNLANDPNNTHTHNIDFHAVMGPGGGAAVTNVAPGETKTLTFKAMRAGAYIYHCAAEGKPWEHVSHGQYGLIIVEPKGGLPAVDKEFYVGQGEWYLKPDQESGGYYDLDTNKAQSEHPDFFTLNGNTKALPKGNTKMVVNQGDRVRLFFGTGGPNIGSNFHIIGQIFDKVYTGDPKDFRKNEETVYIAPGDGAVFEFVTLVPGDYNMVDHALWRASKGAMGFLHVNPRGLWPFEIYFPNLNIPVIP